MQSIWYILKEGLRGFREAKLSNFLSIITVTLAILMIGSFGVLSFNLQKLLASIKNRLEFEIFVNNAYNETQIFQLQEELGRIRGIEKIDYISREQAASIFKQEFGKDVFSILDANPLPASFRIRLQQQYQHADSAQKLLDKFEQLKGVDEVIFRKDILQLLDKHLNILVMVLLGGGILVCFGSLFFIYNTIRLIIVSRSEMIEAMKLVGATPGFIRCPFLIEGFFQTFVGSALAIGILYGCSYLLKQQLPQFLFLPSRLWALLLICGSCMGLLGSSLAIRRFLKY
ncbi:ABC transporter permease [candidate division KSB1 bacterium]|nr:ABC transporter permease [candidate division KSB1 bacterium]